MNSDIDPLAQVYLRQLGRIVAIIKEAGNNPESLGRTILGMRMMLAVYWAAIRECEGAGAGQAAAVFLQVHGMPSKRSN